jgi:comEA protein
MAFLETLQQKVGFTRKEALAILILSGTFLAGISIRWFQSKQQADAESIRTFDYSRSDSAFAARSKPSGSPAQHSSALTQAQNDSVITTKRTQKGLVNINTATKTQLMNLPGIGPSLADRILEHRASNGPFTSTSELRKVKGIGEKKFEKLQPLIRTN